MPCNLAVSIAKAAITDEQRLKLLDAEKLQTILSSFLVEQGYVAQGQAINFMTFYGSDWQSEVQASFRYKGTMVAISVRRGRISVQAGALGPLMAQKLTNQLETSLNAACDLLLGVQVQEMLAAAGLRFETQLQTVDNEGAAQMATVITVNL